MHLSTHLDCDLVAVENADTLTLLVEVTAPTPPADTPRAPATLQVVLDRSGSMRRDRLDGAKTALTTLLDRLAPTDNLGVVAFDQTVQVVVPAGPLTDKPAARTAIAALRAGGSTDLSGGYLRGLQELHRVAGTAGGTVLLVSDGHANAGVTNPDRLSRIAAEAQAQGVTTTTLGFGLGYDERLLGALARGGAGNELFAEDADSAGALIAGQVDGLLAQVAQAASLRLRWTGHVSGVEVVNDVPVTALPDGALVELGSFYAGETRRLLITLHIPGVPALGLTQVATLELVHVALPDLVQHTTTLPVHVNVVPGDQAAGRVPDPTVRSEVLFAQTQLVKRESSTLLSRGQVDAATDLLARASDQLRADAQTLPVELRDELTGEAALLDALAAEAHRDHNRAAKISSANAATAGRTRGRRNLGTGYRLHAVPDRPGAPAAVLALESWEFDRVRDALPPELAQQLAPHPGAVYPAALARAVAAALGDTHPTQWFFDRAGAGGGFRLDRD